MDNQAKRATKLKFAGLWTILAGVTGVIAISVVFHSRHDLGGDYMLIAIHLLILWILSVLLSICGIFLLKRKKWAWISSVIIYIMFIVAILTNFDECYRYGQTVFTWFCPGPPHGYERCKELGGEYCKGLNELLSSTFLLLIFLLTPLVLLFCYYRAWGMSIGFLILGIVAGLLASALVFGIPILSDFFGLI